MLTILYNLHALLLYSTMPTVPTNVSAASAYLFLRLCRHPLLPNHCDHTGKVVTAMLFFVETPFGDLAIHWSDFKFVWLGSTDKGTVDSGRSQWARRECITHGDGGLQAAHMLN